MRFTDPNGELFVIDDIIIAAAIGAVINVGIQGMSGNINSGGDFFLAIGIGAFSGAIGSFAGQAVAGALNFGGFWGGAISGGVGGAVGGFAGGSGNAWLQGANFGQGLKAGLIGGGIGLASGALLGGLSRGINASRNHGNFWTGKGAIYASYSKSGLRPEDVKVGENMEFTSDFAKDVADKTYGKLDYVNRIVTNEIPNPTGSDFTMNNGCIIDRNGKMIDGLTEYLGKGKSQIYLSKSAFTSISNLKIVIGHEYIHATHNFMGYKGILKANAKHGGGTLWTEISAYHWENHIWGIQNGYNSSYEKLLGKFIWWRKDYFSWLINAKY